MAKKKGMEYTMAITPEMKPADERKFLQRAKGLAKKTSEVFAKAFTLKNALIGGGIGALGLGALNFSTAKVAEIGAKGTEALNTADAVAVLSAQGGGDVGRTQALADLLKAKGVDIDAFSRAFYKFQAGVAGGTIKGEATMAGFESALATVMGEKDVEKKAETALQFFDARAGVKLMEFLQMSKSDAQALFSEIHGKKSLESIGAKTTSLSELEDKMAVQNLREEVRARESLATTATKTPNQLLDAILLETKTTNDKLINSLSQLEPLLKNAEIRKGAEEIIDKQLINAISGITEATKSAVKLMASRSKQGAWK